IFTGLTPELGLDSRAGEEYLLGTGLYHAMNENRAGSGEQGNKFPEGGSGAAGKRMLPLLAVVKAAYLAGRASASAKASRENKEPPPAGQPAFSQAQPPERLQEAEQFVANELRSIAGLLKGEEP
ncbi:hypothetical protein LJC59_06050, partial [Desulfovibrio sp. OttesenSCG-928-A18]|nr:hypothetical protein [Desulfovibrio sp. OttesenSCG-928-A18]